MRTSTRALTAAIAIALAAGLGYTAPPAIPTGTGYCVTADMAGTPVRIMVPLHRPDPEHLEELRASIRNALHLGLNQARIRNAGRPEADAELDRWAAAVHGPIRLGTEASRPRLKAGDDGGGEVVCVCLTFNREAPSCAGACADCMACTIR